MYEQYFGLSAPPFQINPDPGFYFESRGHASAFQYLRFGAFQGEGFIVVTGEIGAGKTTLLRALLQELDPERVVAAQLVSTQLGADDLLSAVALAFGIRVDGLSKAKLLVTLEAFLATLATSRRRALLIIDEAQNLSLESIEELRMLSNFQFGNRALLQSFLVGQPELRDLLRQPRLEQLRQRVLASFHLGPMDLAETQGYIEHRLRHVGWQQRPSFEARAFEMIHQATAGVPRRINLLCNRLLLSAYLDEAQRIDVERVRRVERELRGEASSSTSMTGGHGAGGTAAPMLCVATSVQGAWGFAALQRAFARREDLPLAHLLRIVGSCAIPDDRLLVEDLLNFGVDDPGTSVPLGDEPAARCLSDVTQAVASQIQLIEPSAVLIAGDGILELACALAAMAASVPLVLLEFGSGETLSDEPGSRFRDMLDRAADLLFVASDASLRQRQTPGRGPDSVTQVGSVAVDALRLGLERGLRAEGVFGRNGLPTSLLTDPAGYVLVAFRPSQHEYAVEILVDLDRSLRAAGWRVALVCPVEHPRRDSMADACTREMATDVRVICVGGHSEWLYMIRHARCIVSGDAWLRAQALRLGVPCLDLPAPVAHSAAPEQTISQRNKDLAHRLADIIAGGGKTAPVPEMHDGHAADRIAAHLADWLLARQDHEYRRFLQRA